MGNVKWDYDSCYELARQCVKRSEIKERSQRAYSVILKNGWMSDYTWLLPVDVLRHQKRPNRVKWSYEKCREHALKFDTLAEFRKSNPTIYTISKRNGWIDDFDWLSRKGNIYTSRTDNVYAYFFGGLNSVYVGRTIEPKSRDLSHNTSSRSTVFRFATDNSITVPEMTILESGLTVMEGLVREDYYCNKYRDEGWNILNIARTGVKSGSIGGIGHGKWKYGSCYREAQKYRTLKEFRKKSPAAYNKACKNRWVGDYIWLERPHHESNYWTYEKCYEEARKYVTRKQFSKGNCSAYTKACNNGWIDDYVWLESPRTAFKWDYENCYNEARKYTRMADFRNGCGTAYNVSRENRWLKDFDWLKKKDISQKTVMQFSLDGKFVAKYDGVREACRVSGFNNSGISQCCRGKLKSHKGYLWKYKGEE